MVAVRGKHVASQRTKGVESGFSLVTERQVLLTVAATSVLDLALRRPTNQLCRLASARPAVLVEPLAQAGQAQFLVFQASSSGCSRAALAGLQLRPPRVAAVVLLKEVAVILILQARPVRGTVFQRELVAPRSGLRRKHGQYAAYVSRSSTKRRRACLDERSADSLLPWGACLHRSPEKVLSSLTRGRPPRITVERLGVAERLKTFT